MYIPDTNSATPECVVFDQRALEDIDAFDQYGNRVGFTIEYTASAGTATKDCSNGGRAEPYRMQITTYCNQRYDELVELVNNETGFGDQSGYFCEPKFVYYTKKACPAYQISNFQVMFSNNI